ncbi:hypothetical protein [Martelella radicis]|uniref:Uncharacterized protein n=1 Tax=Martelella radicis TaxID=1397476 RepID=A0A7W6KFJ9_9HYPH|nr:hypothetical protein [Martelella radicis]MBB4120314.1 hypothetical protein [Martelella radicis]
MYQLQRFKLLLIWLAINAFLPYLVRLSGIVTIENSLTVGILVLVLLQGLNLVFLRKHWKLAAVTIILNILGFVIVGYFSIVYAIYPIIKVVLLPLIQQ